MRQLIRNLLFLFPKRDRWQLGLLFICMLLTALLEVVGVASIMPFMALIANPEGLHQPKIVTQFAQIVGIEDQLSLQTAAGLLTLTLLFFSNAAALLTNWMMLQFSHYRCHVIGERLLRHYMAQPYEFFLNNNSVELSKNILKEVNRITSSIIIPALQMAAKLVILLLMVSLLVLMHPRLTLGLTVTVGAAYGGLYLVIRRKLARYGRATATADAERFRSSTEALEGIKEIKVSGRSAWFQQKFRNASSDYAKYYTTAEALGYLPKYALEVIAFGSIVLIALYLLTQDRGPQVLPAIALFAFAGYRLMPAMQQIYSSLVQIRYHNPALEIVTGELRRAQQKEEERASVTPLALSQSLALSHVSYAYPDGTQVLKDISLTIKPNTTIGLAGMSGAGKTTLADIMLGLLAPNAGSMAADGVEIVPENLSAWQALLAYVPQQIYLIDDTIAANIAFGVAPEEINREKLEKAAKSAHLHDFIMTLPKGYDTRTGEKGVKLSGGQRQRIGIARALYSQPKILIMDEATSALDNITENAVMEAINDMAGRMMLIIIAHRLTTLQACDRILLMEQGNIIASGSYGELLETSPAFRLLAKPEPASLSAA